MSTTMNVPAHIAKRIADRNNAGNKASSVSDALGADGLNIPKISTRASRFRLVEDGVETVIGTELDVVVVGANPRVAKVYYGKPYDPKATDMRPDCHSNDGINPDPAIADPVSRSCANCPNNVLGSKITPSGAKSKACADQRHLAVVPAADPSKIYGLTVPVSGMKALREYVKELSNYNLIPEEVVTELSFDPNADFPKLMFRRKGFLSEKALDKVEKIGQSDMVKVVTRQMTNDELAAALGKSAPQIAHKPEVPAVEHKPEVVDEAYEEEVVEAEAKPEPEASKPKAKAKPKAEVVKEEPQEEPQEVADLSDLEAALENMFDDD